MTEQLGKWKGQFGDEYTDRNLSDDINIQQRMMMWNGIFMHIAHDLPNKILEVGAGIGANLISIANLYNNIQREVKLTAIEPNDKAKNYLKRIQHTKIVEQDIFKIEATNGKFDLSFTCGVLIHVRPDQLNQAMAEMYRVTRKYILCIEYFSPECRELSYRGENNILWSNDFGSLYLKWFPLRCVGYGFLWKRMSGLDNLSWFLFEKTH